MEILSEQQKETQVAALEHELAGYLATGRENRAAEVRAEIARLTGAAAPAPRPSRTTSTDRLAGKQKSSRAAKE